MKRIVTKVVASDRHTVNGCIVIKHPKPTKMMLDNADIDAFLDSIGHMPGYDYGKHWEFGDDGFGTSDARKGKLTAVNSQGLKFDFKGRDALRHFVTMFNLPLKYHAKLQATFAPDEDDPRVETAGWFEDLTPHQQKEYIRRYPNSKYARNARKKKADDKAPAKKGKKAEPVKKAEKKKADDKAPAKKAKKAEKVERRKDAEPKFKPHKSRLAAQEHETHANSARTHMLSVLKDQIKPVIDTLEKAPSGLDLPQLKEDINLLLETAEDPHGGGNVHGMARRAAIDAAATLDKTHPKLATKLRDVIRLVQYHEDEADSHDRRASEYEEEQYRKLAPKGDGSVKADVDRLLLRDETLGKTLYNAYRTVQHRSGSLTRPERKDRWDEVADILDKAGMPEPDRNDRAANQVWSEFQDAMIFTLDLQAAVDATLKANNPKVDKEHLKQLQPIIKKALKDPALAQELLTSMHDHAQGFDYADDDDDADYDED